MSRQRFVQVKRGRMNAANPPRCIYVHTNGQGDFRQPTHPRVIVGPLHSIVEGQIHFTPGWSLDRIRALFPAYVYQQPQLTRVDA